jgi:hypothetical protein
MSILVVPTVIVAVFFVAGVVLGVTAIISLSVTGCDKCSRAWPQDNDPVYRPRYGRRPEPEDDARYDSPEYPPRWPSDGYQD